MSSYWSHITAQSTVFFASDSTGKERDAETGYSYFGARYMDHELMTMWLSVDPMADKYPSISPYAYCAWNPIKLVDPEGKEVEYTTYKDKITVFFQRIFNKQFRIRYNDLKKSEEIYVFNGYYKEGEKGGETTTNGKKIFINYNSWKNKKQGSDKRVNLRHETEHAVQFEYGEVGFDKNMSPDKTWGNSAVNFDLTDEVKARETGYYGFSWSSDPEKNVRNSWTGTFKEKMYFLHKQEAYKNLPIEELNNKNKIKIKTDSQYMLPYRKRNY